MKGHTMTTTTFCEACANLRHVDDAGAGTDAELEAGVRALALHAPEYVQLKPFGACGTPAVWVDRGVDARTIMNRLTALAEGRHAARESLQAQP